MDIVLSSARLALRRFAQSDADLLVELDGDPEVMRYLTGGEPTPRDRIETVILPEMLALYDEDPAFGYLAAFEYDTGDFVGWFELRIPEDVPPGPLPAVFELGYRLRRAHWGRGYATEVSRLLVEHAFADFAAVRVFATTMAVNTASRRVLTKVGMSYVGTYYPDLPPIPGAKHGDVVYALSRPVWESRKNTQEH
jgi:RimJ/RimL family protein N-acetyltransferase